MKKKQANIELIEINRKQLAKARDISCNGLIKHSFMLFFLSVLRDKLDLVTYQFALMYGTFFLCSIDMRFYCLANITGGV